MLSTITLYIKNLLPVASQKRCLSILTWYVFSLATPSDKHSQAFASKISKKDDSLFSDLLGKEISFSLEVLNRSSKRRLNKLLKVRKPIHNQSPWTVCLIIDSTLHERSSEKVDNGQKHYHGNKYVTGHLWTNIGLLINGQYVPLPPIVFYTRDYCKLRGIPYKTEHEKISDFLRNFSFKQFSKKIHPNEILVLLDSGYDNKKIQSAIISRQWDFISSLKCCRNISDKPKDWKRIDRYFGDGRRPFISVRLESYRGKRKVLSRYQVKQRVGLLKGVRQRVKLLCSKRLKDKRMKFLACSNIKVSPKLILLAYKKRWTIEIFHREVKSYLGLEDAGVKRFNSLHSHVHFVYVTYNMLKERYPGDGIRVAQMKTQWDFEQDKGKGLLKQLSLINGSQHAKTQIRSDIEALEILKAA